MLGKIKSTPISTVACSLAESHWYRKHRLKAGSQCYQDRSWCCHVFPAPTPRCARSPCSALPSRGREEGAPSPAARPIRAAGLAGSQEAWPDPGLPCSPVEGSHWSKGLLLGRPPEEPEQPLTENSLLEVLDGAIMMYNLSVHQQLGKVSC